MNPAASVFRIPCETFRVGRDILFVSLFYRNSLTEEEEESQQDIPQSQLSASPIYKRHDRSAFPFPLSLGNSGDQAK